MLIKPYSKEIVFIRYWKRLQRLLSKQAIRHLRRISWIFFTQSQTNMNELRIYDFEVIYSIESILIFNFNESLEKLFIR